MKQKQFVKLYTDKDNKETFLNATETSQQVYNVSNREVAKSIGAENLAKPVIIQAIEKKVMKKEDIQDNLASFTEKISNAIKDNVTLENVPLLKENREYLSLQARINGDLQERMTNIQINVLNDYSDMFKNAMEENSSDTSSDRGGEE